jgi:hypothetical protein
MTVLKLDLDYCETTIQRVCAGDRQALNELVRYMWPYWVEYVRTTRRMGPLARSEDHVRNVAMRLLEKANNRDGEHFRQYVEWRLRASEKTFEDWTIIVAANEVRGYIRTVLGARTDESDAPSAKRLLNEFATAQELGVRPPYTAEATAHQLMEFACSRLSADQLAALGIWLEGGGYDEIERELAIADGKRLVRAAVAVLRRNFSAIR